MRKTTELILVFVLTTCGVTGCSGDGDDGGGDSGSDLVPGTVTGDYSFEEALGPDGVPARLETPIAVGAAYVVIVNAADGGDNEGGSLMTSDDESVVDPVRSYGDWWELRAISPGTVTISVSPRDDSVALSGTFVVAAEDAADAEVRHTCTTDERARYPSGHPYRFTYATWDSAGDPLLADFLHDLSVSPVGGATILESYGEGLDGVPFMSFIREDTDDDVTLTFNPYGNSIIIVPRGSEPTDGALIDPAAAGGVAVDETAYFYVIPTVLGEARCQTGNDLLVANHTDTICAASATAPESPRVNGADEDAWLEVTGLTAGSCDLTLDFGTVLDPFGVDQDVSIAVNP